MSNLFLKKILIFHNTIYIIIYNFIAIYLKRNKKNINRDINDYCYEFNNLI